MKRFFAFFLALPLFFILLPGVYAGVVCTGGSMQQVCDSNPQCCARDVSDCESREFEYGDPAVTEQRYPFNCFFLEEPIGGKPGYDLYTQSCVQVPAAAGGAAGAVAPPPKTVCTTRLWYGSSVPSGTRGPIQAILTYSPDQPEQGSFGLLYSYVGTIYKYMSGLIVGLTVLFIIYGGVQMILSAGDSGKFDEGKDRILSALLGLALWFLASLILYTINPTFFEFGSSL